MPPPHLTSLPRHHPPTPAPTPRHKAQYRRTADLTEQALNDFRAVFDMFDRNNNSTIDAQEFANIIHLLGDARPSQENLNRYIRIACGVDENDQVPDALTYRQFLNFFAAERGDGGDKIDERQVYRVLDKNGDGKVSEAELRGVLEGFGMKVSSKEAKAMLEMMNEGRGQPGFERFATLVTRIRDFAQQGGVDYDSDSSSDCP